MEAWLGLPPGTFPDSWRALTAHLQTVLASGVLQVTPLARRMAEQVLAPTPWVAPLAKPWRLLTLGLLPPALRAAYGFAWSERDERAFRRLVALIRRGVARAPRHVRHWPEARRLRLAPSR